MLNPPKMDGAFSAFPLERLEWLAYTQVLTDKLKALSPQVEMQVLAHSFESPNAWEQTALCISDKRLLRRSILMSSHGKACWFARTLIPESTYQQSSAFFDKLNHTSLAHLIYNEPRVERRLVHGFVIQAEHPAFEWLSSDWVQGKAELQARLSVFHFEQRSFFYLYEIFLPALWQQVGYA